MPGPNIPGSRATEYDVERFERCEKCSQSVSTFVRVFDQGEPYYWCLACFGAQTQKGKGQQAQITRLRQIREEIRIADGEPDLGSKVRSINAALDVISDILQDLI
jgi:hypothetical protein